MSIPDYQTLMLPALEFVSDGQEHTASELMDYLATRFELTQEERQAQIPSGGLVLYHRMHWALSYLRQAKLVTAQPKAG